MLHEKVENLCERSHLEGRRLRGDSGAILEVGKAQGRMARIVLTGGMVAVEGVFDGLHRGYDYGGDRIIGPEDEVEIGDDVVVSKRGKITEFTRKSQSRLMKALSAWEPRGKLLVVTLTYGEFPEPREAKRHFEKFRMKLRKKYPYASGMWKIEYQARGAPHFHLVVDTGEMWLSDDDIIVWRSVVHDAWRYANSVGGRTQVDRAKDEKRAKFYLAKEVGKMVQSSAEWRGEIEDKIKHVGRVWGWINPSMLKFASEEWQVPVDTARLFKERIQTRVMNAWLKDGVLKRHEGGAISYRGVGDFDFRKLPGWQLFVDPDAELKAIVAEVRDQTGFDLFAHSRRVKTPDYSVSG